MLWFVDSYYLFARTNAVFTSVLRLRKLSEFGRIREQLLRSCVCTVCSQIFLKSLWFAWVCACRVVVFYLLIKYIWYSSPSHYYKPTHMRLWPNRRTNLSWIQDPTLETLNNNQLRQRNWLYSKLNISSKVHLLRLFLLALILWDCWQGMLPTDWLKRRWSKYKNKRFSVWFMLTVLLRP